VTVNIIERELNEVLARAEAAHINSACARRLPGGLRAIDSREGTDELSRVMASPAYHCRDSTASRSIAAQRSRVIGTAMGPESQACKNNNFISYTYSAQPLIGHQVLSIRLRYCSRLGVSLQKTWRGLDGKGSNEKSI
jgi:hypothetical protein